MCQQCETHDRNRRSFLKRVVGGATILAVGRLGHAVAQNPRALGHPSILSETIQFPNGAEPINGFLARPRKELRSRGVLIMHGNPGISEDVQNTAAQLAVAGFAALAVDWASRARQDWRKVPPAEFGLQQKSDAASGVEFLLQQEFVRGDRVGFVGFCGGARLAFMLAADSPKVGAIVSFYGAARTRAGGKLPTPEPLDIVASIRVPVQGHYGELDEVAQANDAKDLERALRAQKVPVEMHYYKSAGHRFYNHLNPPGSDPGYDYVPKAAQEAHARMIRFLKKYLR